MVSFSWNIACANYLLFYHFILLLSCVCRNIKLSFLCMKSNWLFNGVKTLMLHMKFVFIVFRICRGSHIYKWKQLDKNYQTLTMNRISWKMIALFDDIGDFLKKRGRNEFVPKLWYLQDTSRCGIPFQSINSYNKRMLNII